MKNIILALDGMTKRAAMDIAEEVKEYIWGVKFNDLIDKYGVDIITDFRMKGIQVFADPKLKDIPNTVRNRIKHYEDAGANFVTVMADGGRDMMIAAKESVNNCEVIGVTVLTSLSLKDCLDIYNREPSQTILRLVNDMIWADLDGLVCSPNELNHLDDDNYLIAITPGIRPEWYAKKDDQKRVSTPYTAIRDGADFLVIGRPITQAKDVLQAAKMTYDEVNNSRHNLNIELYLNTLNSMYKNKDPYKKILETCMEFLEIDNDHCSRLFEVSRSTIDRWLKGDTQPHTVMRKLVYDTFIDKFKKLKI